MNMVVDEMKSNTGREEEQRERKWGTYQYTLIIDNKLRVR